MNYYNQEKVHNDDFQIIGKSKEIVHLLETVKKLESSDAAVMIYGESGTGKELFARYIHNSSKRKNNNFISINCAAIPNQLLENEFFGHKKGAFTDAVDDYIGKFGYANNGTIFLDEIAGLDILLQAKLLRVLQFKEYEPIGSNEIKKSDVRIIAASNKNLPELIKEKRFREDLYYRLNVVPIYIPALKEREGDVELLANYFLEIYNEKNRKMIKGFSIGVINVLNKYEWPGNVRELQNIVERAVVFCDEEYISFDQINLNNSSKLNNFEKSNMNLKTAVNEFKKEYIVKILEKNSWNQTKAAKSLEIQRTYLSRLIKELNIDKI